MLQCLKKKISVIELTGSDPAKPLDNSEFWWLAFEWSTLTSTLNLLHSSRMTCAGHFFFSVPVGREKSSYAWSWARCWLLKKLITFLPDHLGNLIPSCFNPFISEVFYIIVLGSWNNSYFLNIFLYIWRLFLVCLCNLTIGPSSPLGFLNISSPQRNARPPSKKRSCAQEQNGSPLHSPSTSAIVKIAGLKF